MNAQTKLDEIADRLDTTLAQIHYCNVGQKDGATISELNIGAIKSAMLEYAAELQKDKERERLVEALRKAILWAESCSFRIEDREQLNWTYLNEARAVYAATTRKETK